MKMIAHTIKGLEAISLKELSDKIEDFRLDAVEAKRIHFSTSKLPQKPALFRTIDDLSIFIRKVDVGKLTHLVDVLSDIDFPRYYNWLTTIRLLDRTYSLTVSSYKNRSINKEELIRRVSLRLASQLSLTYTPRNHSNFDIRLMIEKDICSIMIKVPSKSLFFREYRVNSQPGAIKPSIAGAMLYELTSGKNGFRIVDNFCGSGTFLCEARMDGNSVYGGDISKDSTRAARDNLKSIRSSELFDVKTLDATKSPWPNNSFDIAISNFPWNKQIKVDYFTKLYSAAIQEYARILKKDGTLCIIGSKQDLMIKLVKENFDCNNRRIDTFPVGYLGQNPTIIISRDGRTKSIPPPHSKR